MMMIIYYINKFNNSHQSLIKPDSAETECLYLNEELLITFIGETDTIKNQG